MPRHPPCALHSLSQQRQNKSLQKINYARVHYADLKQQPHQPPHTTTPQGGDKQRAGKGGNQKPDASGPNSVPTPPLTTRPRSTPTHTPQGHRQVVLTTRTDPDRAFIDDSTSEHHHALPHIRWESGRVLLRKEVIQPHLPVRLPCYDFVLIASPTFDGSLPQGVGPPASGVADFHDVTGGVYKARERIHRSVADLRLLATPTSWGRVADPNPN
jgi:hypothetical protein